MIEITTGRECGKCSLCCKLLHVIELNKPSNTWCEHCRPGYGGCTIHETRPKICRGYFCGWMMSKNVGDEWYPLKCHMVISLTVLDNINTVAVSVDKNYPDVWRQEPYFRQLKNMAYHGLHPETVDQLRLVQVRCGSRVWLIVPNGALEITNCSYVVKCVGKKHFDIETFKTQEQARDRAAELVMHS